MHSSSPFFNFRLGLFCWASRKIGQLSNNSYPHSKPMTNSKPNSRPFLPSWKSSRGGGFYDSIRLFQAEKRRDFRGALSGRHSWGTALAGATSPLAALFVIAPAPPALAHGDHTIKIVDLWTNEVCWTYNLILPACTDSLIKSLREPALADSVGGSFDYSYDADGRDRFWGDLNDHDSEQEPEPGPEPGETCEENPGQDKCNRPPRVVRGIQDYGFPRPAIQDQSSPEA